MKGIVAFNLRENSETCGKIKISFLHPSPNEILLVIEVSDSTLNYDQTVKLAIYAEAQIQNYWIVNLIAQQLEHYSQPYQDTQGAFGYRTKQIALRDETIAVSGFPDLFLNLSRVFPGSSPLKPW